MKMVTIIIRGALRNTLSETLFTILKRLPSKLLAKQTAIFEWDKETQRYENMDVWVRREPIHLYFTVATLMGHVLLRSL